MRRSLFNITLVALAHAAIFIYVQRSDWPSTTAWSDQAGYQRLAEGLVKTGRLTRYPDSDVFVPEVIRTPGYPLFVAAIYRVFGIRNNMAVAIAQAVVFAAICWLVFAIVRRAISDRAALLAAAMASLYSPFPYFGGLIVTELWTTFFAAAALLVCLRAAQRASLRDFAFAGVLFSATTLVRPAFVLMPFFFAIAAPILVRSQRSAEALKGWACLAVVAALTMVPWLAYNYVNLNQVTLSPAGGIGRGLWEGSWQGRWPGRIQADLTTLAEMYANREELARRVQARAAELRMDPAPMLQYVNEWRDLRAIWETPTNPTERAKARVAADAEYLRQAIANIRQDPWGHIERRLTRGLFVLWAAEVPIKYGRINTTPVVVIRIIWIAQVILMLLAAWGAIWLARHGRWLEAVILVLPIIYVTGVHLPLLCEARQSLPVKPAVLALAAIALWSPRWQAPRDHAEQGSADDSFFRDDDAQWRP